MSAKVQSILDAGNQAIVIDVECHMTNGLPNIVLVGFASKAVDESKERIRSAFSSAKLELPRKRITINLAPADIPKDSTSFDLPIAVAILLAGGLIATKPAMKTAFDEFPEFGRGIIEALRQPLEDRVISVARAKDTIIFPANFMLVATSNPCPCGYYGTARGCTCLPHHIMQYHRKLSGPILDRIDLFVDVNEVKHVTLLRDQHEEPSKSIQERVIQARARQQSRYKKPTSHNATLSNREIKRFIKLTGPAETLLNQAAERMSLSPRSYMRLLKVAQTVADLDEQPEIDTAHISEALQYRRQLQET